MLTPHKIMNHTIFPSLFLTLALAAPVCAETKITGKYKITTVGLYAINPQFWVVELR